MIRNWSIKDVAQDLLAELDGGRLEVCKVPGREGGYIRVPVSVNAEWYQRFCRQFETSRRRYPKLRTIIKRCHTRKALKKIANNGSDGVYVQRLLDFIEDVIEDKYEETMLTTKQPTAEVQRSDFG